MSKRADNTYMPPLPRHRLPSDIPTYPELDHAHAAATGTLFQKHLGHLISEEDYKRTLTDFLAFMVQFPGRKIRWAVLLQSVEGAGKTYLAEVRDWMALTF